ncbi:hypothetical protein TPAU25S_02816 [Tsukamurella paurometabola]
MIDDPGGLLIVDEALELAPLLELEGKPAVGNCWNIIARVLA